MTRPVHPKGTPSAGPGTPHRRARAIWLAALVGLAVIALVAFLVTRGGAGSGSAAAGTPAASTPSSTGVSAPSSDISAPSAATGSGVGSADLPAALRPVGLSATASEGNGVVVTLPRIESVQGQGSGPGNVSGPAVRVTVRIHNGTRGAISVGGVAVNMYYGSQRLPASPLDDPSRIPFHGSVQPGRSADGVYVYSVPADGRQAVTVEVGYQAGAPLLLFTGPVR